MKYCVLIIVVVIVLSGNSGCKKFVGIPTPTTDITESSVFASNSTAAAALSGIYIAMENNSVGGGEYGLSPLLGLSADDFNLFPGAGTLLTQVYINGLISSNPPTVWFDMYFLIYQANAVIEGVEASSGITTSMKAQLVGEAEFIRAFCHFYLENIYGNVPLITSTNYDLNKSLGQSPRNIVYAQIISDLKDAQSRLGRSYFDEQGNVSSERVRPNSLAAAALLARTYLYVNKYDSAEQEASLVISNPIYQLYDSAGIDSVFLTNSQEAIWQLELPVSDIYNTPDGNVFLPGLLNGQGPTTSNPYTLSASLISSFEPNDLRRKQWIDSLIISGDTFYFPFKYKLYYDMGNPPGEYPTILRLGEQYLIRAEARAEQGNLLGAAEDLNLIRNRAGLPSITASTQGNLLAAILQERRVELFTEYGHRWFDLKRTGMMDNVMPIATAIKGGNWNATDSLYPIPLGEIKADPNLKQNNGYQ